MKKLTITCKHCGTMFNSYPSDKRKFCSLGCAYKDPDRTSHVHKKNRGFSICRHCGIQFAIKTCSGLARFCSRSCSGKDAGKKNIQRIRLMNRPPSVKVMSKCQECGAIFISSPSAKRIFCSRKCAAPTRARKAAITQRLNGSYNSSNSYSRCISGWSEIGGKRCFFRSNWERIYAEYLERLKLCGIIQDWAYELDVIEFPENELNLVFHRPDFVVTHYWGKEYHEVKGIMDAKSLLKIKLTRQLRPDTPILVRDFQWFKDNAKMDSGRKNFVSII